MTKLLALLAVAATLGVAAFVFTRPAVRADSGLTPAAAQALIAKGERLDTIDKSVWKQLLTPTQYDILWHKGTERPFSGALVNNHQEGVYVTAGCRLPVFASTHKFESGTGWPSFWDVVNRDNVVLKRDWSLGIPRTEVLSKCGEHLGHVFKDGPAPTGLRYCINSAALDFVPAKDIESPAKPGLVPPK